MKPNRLADVTLKTIANTRHAAEQAIDAYRAGGHRLVAAVDRGVGRTVSAPAERLVPRLADVRGRLAALADAGIERISAQTGKAIDVTTRLAARQVERAAERADAVDNPLVANGLKAAARFSLAGARIALALSARLADGAVALSVAAGNARRRPGRKTAARAERATTAAPRAARGRSEAPAARKGAAKGRPAVRAKKASSGRAKREAAA